MKSVALIFGYNDYTSQIAKNVYYKYKDIFIYKLADDAQRDDLQGYPIETFSLSEEWKNMGELYDMKKSVAFCVLEDDAENMFLTISLRSRYEELTIIALSSNKESANKLIMAGANKVIPVVQTTASIITDMLDKPIVTEILHNILYENNDLKVAQLEITDALCFEKKYPADVDWNHDYGIVVLSIIHKSGATEFIYAAKERHHHIENGDIFVVVGYSEDIENFRNILGGKKCQ
jgi:Trk K+ transport system NAD-binding subunit